MTRCIPHLCGPSRLKSNDGEDIVLIGKLFQPLDCMSIARLVLLAADMNIVWNFTFYGSLYSILNSFQRYTFLVVDIRAERQSFYRGVAFQTMNRILKGIRPEAIGNGRYDEASFSGKELSFPIYPD